MSNPLIQPGIEIRQTVEGYTSDTFDGDGLTLRDYFAAKAMNGDVSVAEIAYEITDKQLTDRAKLYYRIADAMLAQRAVQ